MQNKKPNAKKVVPVVIAVFLILASFVAAQNYIIPKGAQPHNVLIVLLFSVFAIAVAVIAVYESRLRFNVDPATV